MPALTSYRGNRGTTMMAPSNRTQGVRPPAVAGLFYAAAAEALAADVRSHLDHAAPPPSSTGVPKALIVPHAGYVYSGDIAANAYARLAPYRDTIRRVVLLGPT